MKGETRTVCITTETIPVDFREILYSYWTDMGKKRPARASRVRKDRSVTIKGSNPGREREDFT